MLERAKGIEPSTLSLGSSWKASKLLKGNGQVFPSYGEHTENQWRTWKHAFVQHGYPSALMGGAA